ncbi:MAG: VCBS repeat-containing protein [Bacteroidetes bacterium]|nr:VCBS repeat-containing protein [Bacteroidota bacterium]
MKKRSYIILTAVLVFFTCGSTIAQCFNTQTSWDIPPYNFEKTYGFEDLDGDGAAELFVSKIGSVNINTYKFNTGTFDKIGEFGLRPQQQLSPLVQDFKTAKFGNDEFKDILSYIQWFGISVTMRTSHYEFDSVFVIPFTSSADILNLQTADCNNDGLDEIYYIQNNKLFTIHNTNGVLGGLDSISFWNYTILRMGVTDINADGFNDIILITNGSWDMRIYQLRGSATGYTSSYTTFTSGLSNSPLATIDMNGDNFPELILNQSYNTMKFRIINNNNGNLSAGLLLDPFPNQNIKTTLSSVNQIVVEDFDNDQISDVLIACDTSIIILKRDSLGGFSSFRSAKKDESILDWKLSSANINGDQFPDPVLYSKSLEFYLGADTINELSYFAYYGSILDLSEVFVVDINNDGLKDVIKGRNGIETIIQTERGKFQLPRWYAFPTSTLMAAGDFDQDGLADYVMQDFGPGWGQDSLFVFLANGFSKNATPVFLLPCITNLKKGRTGNINGDNFLDLVLFSSTTAPNVDSAFVFLGNGDGTFTPGQKFSAYLYAFENVELEDINYDGFDDMMACTYFGGRFRAWKGNGDGTFTAGSNISMQGVDNFDIGNLDGTGNKEIVVTQYSFSDPNGNLKIYTVNNNLIFTALTNLVTVNNHPNDVFIHDFNDDGFLDLHAGNTNNYDKGLYLGNGTLTGFIEDTLFNGPPFIGQTPLFDDPNGPDDFIIYNGGYYYAPGNLAKITTNFNQSPSICDGKTITLKTMENNYTIHAWNTGETTSSIEVSSSGNYYLTITDTSTMCTYFSDTLTFNFVNCDSVWPGDANRDFIVDQHDLFPIAANFNDSGVVRTAISNQWAPWAASDWNQEYTFNNLKFIDSNGDGAINEMDTVAVSANFNNIYSPKPSSAPTPASLSTSPIYLSKVLQGINIGDTVRFNVYAATSASPLIQMTGLSLSLTFDNSMVALGSPSIHFEDSSFIGNKFSDWLSIEKINGNTISSAISRKDLSFVTGYGKIGEFQFLLNQNLSSNYTFTYSTNGSGFVDMFGEFKPFNVSTDSISFSITSLFEEEGNYLQLLSANPVKGGDEITIATSFPSGKILANWYTSSGQHVNSQQLLTSNSLLNLKAPNNAGFYILQLSMNGKNQQFKIVVY